MAKFCGKCGSALDEQTGLCPNCDKEIKIDAPKPNIEPPAENPQKQSINEKQINNNSAPDKKPSKNEIIEAKRAAKKQAKKDKKKAKRASMTTGQKIKRFLLKILLVVIILAVLSAGVTGMLVYYDVVDIPVVERILISTGIKEKPAKEISDDKENSENTESVINTESTPESYEVTPPDADAYFEDNSEVINEIDANDSDVVLSEAEISDDLTDRGFGEYPITTEYSMDGEYYEETDISDSSSSKHPIYQTYYITENGDIWTIFVINDAVMANPVSYNDQSDLGVQLIISESDTVTSYDSTTNKFYETIPDESVLIVKTVERIDADTLEDLTIEEIDDL